MHKGAKIVTKLLLDFYHLECRLFHKVNQHFDKKILNRFFSSITYLGGATFTIAVTLLMILFSSNQTQLTALASALSLAISHIPVAIIKKLFPRKRPYLTLEQTRYPMNPLKDHSFPSGHTTAFFSVAVPFTLYIPYLAFILIPIGISVGLSRIYLGLHYPSDVLAGGILGSSAGILCFIIIH